MHDAFIIKDIEFKVKCLIKGKVKGINGYHAKILKIGSYILIRHFHNLFNIVVKKGFPKIWIKSLTVHILKSSEKNNPSNYTTIVISPLIAKFYSIILEKKINLWLENHDK
jgi:hypothetical protein